jgi:hypothetical protein
MEMTNFFLDDGDGLSQFAGGKYDRLVYNFRTYQGRENVFAIEKTVMNALNTDRNKCDEYEKYVFEDLSYLQYHYQDYYVFLQKQ